MELFQAVTLAEARRLLDENWRYRPAGTERLKIEQALGRVLARPVASPEDIPAFPRSTVDGLAVESRDTFGASEGIPAYLELAGEVVMGEAGKRESHTDSHGRDAAIGSGRGGDGRIH